jgi:hypothetical protein
MEGRDKRIEVSLDPTLGLTASITAPLFPLNTKSGTHPKRVNKTTNLVFSTHEHHTLVQEPFFGQTGAGQCPSLSTLNSATTLMTSHWPVVQPVHCIFFLFFFFLSCVEFFQLGVMEVRQPNRALPPY